jgi:hypothetical protein
MLIEGSNQKNTINHDGIPIKNEDNFQKPSDNTESLEQIHDIFIE